MSRKLVLLIIFSMLFVALSSCDEEEESTTFTGTVTREADKKPAVGVKIFVIGYDVEQMTLWPASVEVTRNMVAIPYNGKFTISIPHNASVDEYKLHAEHPSGSGTISITSGCDWPCSDFKPGSKNTLTLEVQL